MCLSADVPSSAVNAIYVFYTAAYLLKARGEHTMKKTAAKGWVSGVRFAKSAQHYVQLRCVFTTFLLQTRIVFSCCTTVVMRTDRTCSLRTAGVRGRSLTYGRVHQGGNILPFEDCWYLLKFGHGYRRKLLGCRVCSDGGALCWHVLCVTKTRLPHRHWCPEGCTSTPGTKLPCSWLHA